MITDRERTSLRGRRGYTEAAARRLSPLCRCPCSAHTGAASCSRRPWSRRPRRRCGNPPPSPYPAGGERTALCSPPPTQQDRRIDIRLRPRPGDAPWWVSLSIRRRSFPSVLPLSGSLFSAFRVARSWEQRANTTSSMKLEDCRKCMTYRNAAIGGPSHSHR